MRTRRGGPERPLRGPGGVPEANRFGTNRGHSTPKVGLAWSMYRLEGVGLGLTLQCYAMCAKRNEDSAV